MESVYELEGSPEEETFKRLVYLQANSTIFTYTCIAVYYAYACVIISRWNNESNSKVMRNELPLNVFV